MDESLPLDGSFDEFAATADVLCPKRIDRICPARELIVKMYTDLVDPDLATELPREFHPALNPLKMRSKLSEHSAQVAFRGCDAEIGECPVRIDMDNSPVRKFGVSVFRSLKKAIGRQ